MKTLWTPGPWVVEDGDGYEATGVWERCAPSGNGQPGRYVAQVVGDDAQVEPNASLIAAAPELYEALEAIVDFWYSGTGSSDKTIRMLRDSGFIDDASAALKKARGES